VRGRWCSFINNKALCTAPPKTLAHSPSQTPLSCSVAPPSQRELKTKAAAAAAAAWRGGRAPPTPRRPSPAPRPVACPPPRPLPRPAPRPSRARPSCVAPGQRGERHACVGRGFRRWKMTRAAMSTFALLSFAAFTCLSFTCHLRAGVGGGKVV